ncbi:MAG: hypothetical protein M3Q65_13160 [Chloroflexota bacterium]|nr:hypothetical protein [Chloroflexota bacterium]
MVLGRDNTLDAIILVAVAWYASRLLREQRQPVATLWVLPALLALVVALQRDRLPVVRPALLGVAVAAGALSGLVVGRLSYRRADRRAGAIVSRGTWLGVLLWPGVAALTLLAQRALRDRLDDALTGELNVAVLAFVVGHISGLRTGLYWRYTLDTDAGGGRQGRADA